MHKQRREDVRQRQHHQPQRILQEEFECIAEQGFHSPVANIMHAARLLDHINNPAFLESINQLQRAALQLNDKEKMPSLSHDCVGSSRTPGGRRRRQRGAQNNQEQQPAPPNQDAPPAHHHLWPTLELEEEGTTGHVHHREVIT